MHLSRGVPLESAKKGGGGIIDILGYKLQNFSPPVPPLNWSTAKKNPADNPVLVYTSNVISFFLLLM